MATHPGSPVVDAGDRPRYALLRSAVFAQHGEIKVGRWQRYEADWLLAPPEGFIWAATTHLGPVFIRGFDRYTAGAGQMRWRLFGRVPLLSATGSDVTRSAMGAWRGSCASCRRSPCRRQ